MSIRHNDFEPSEDAPFKYDKLDREKYAKILTNIVKNYADGFVMSINNPWGDGKTTFIKMWRKYLDKYYSTLHFNAWESDFEDDVLVSLVSQLSDLNKEGKYEKSFKKVVAESAPLVTKMSKIILKGLINNYIGEDVAGDMADIVVDSGTASIQKELEVYAKKKKSRKDFKDSLQNYVNEVGKDSPVIFFIDELDRCKPSYAVKVLEQIKHLFSVQGIVFVLSIDKIQLGNSIRGFYGSDRIDADEYLKRFIDLEFSLPIVSNTKFCDYLYQYYDFKDFFDSDERKGLVHRNEKHELLNLSRNIVLKFDINLRSIDKLFSHLKIILSSFSSTEPVFPDLIMLLIYLKNYKLKIYQAIVQFKVEPLKLSKRILNELEIDPENTFNDETIEINIAQLLLFYSNTYKNRTNRGHNTKVLMDEIKGFNPKIYLILERLTKATNMHDSHLASLEIINFTERIDLFK